MKQSGNVYQRMPRAIWFYEKTAILYVSWGGNDAIYNQPYFKRFPKDTVRGYGVEVVLLVDDIESFYEQVKDVANIVEPLVEQHWGLKDFRCTDPFGYYLRFTSKHNILDKGNAVD